MTQGELLAGMAAELERASIPYMVVGSLGLSAMWEVAQEMAAP
jgi:hypothetical protein